MTAATAALRFGAKLTSLAVDRPGAMAATVPLWFMAVYLMLIAAAPLTHRAWNAYRWWTVAALCGAALTVDVIRFAGDVEWIGWVNFVGLLQPR